MTKFKIGDNVKVIDSHGKDYFEGIVMDIIYKALGYVYAIKVTKPLNDRYEIGEIDSFGEKFVSSFEGGEKDVEKVFSR